jgi:dynactin complex subunit
LGRPGIDPIHYIICTWGKNAGKDYTVLIVLPIVAYVNVWPPSPGLRQQNELHFFVNKVDIKFSEVLHFVNKRNNSLLLKILNLDLLSYPYFMTHTVLIVLPIVAYVNVWPPSPGLRLLLNHRIFSCKKMNLYTIMLHLLQTKNNRRLDRSLVGPT